MVLKGTPGENGVPEVHGEFFTGGFSAYDPDASTENKIKGGLKADSPFFRNDDDAPAPVADEGPVLKGTPGENGVPEVHGEFFTGGFSTYDPDASTENKIKGGLKA